MRSISLCMGWNSNTLQFYKKLKPCITCIFDVEYILQSCGKLRWRVWIWRCQATLYLARLVRLLWIFRFCFVLFFHWVIIYTNDRMIKELSYRGLTSRSTLYPLSPAVIHWDQALWGKTCDQFHYNIAFTIHQKVTTKWPQSHGIIVAK